MAVMLIAGIVSIINSIPLSIRTIYSYSKSYLGVSARGNQNSIPEVREEIFAESPIPIDRIMTARASEASVKSIVGSWPFVVLALNPEDLDAYLNRVTPGSSLTGRMPESGSPEAIVGRPVADNLGLTLGDPIIGKADKAGYSPKDVEIVGIIESDIWLILTTYEYHKQNHFPPVDVLLVFAENQNDQRALDKWAEKQFEGRRPRIYAYHLLEEETTSMFEILYSILNVVIFTLVIVITLMMAMLMSIYLQQRIPEFGLLQAIGYAKKRLIRRMMLETLIVLVGGWATGVAAAYGMLLVVKAKLMDPNAFILDPLDKTAYLYSTPVPIAIMLAAVLTIALKFRKFDPVTVVERRLL
jgi:putative ABC transport system permease protein/lipoprotein-releasing system permease protein